MFCGPTVRKKSRSYAIGCASPLLLMMIMDQPPEKSWSLSMGLREIISVSMSQNLVQGITMSITLPYQKVVREYLYTGIRFHLDLLRDFAQCRFDNLSTNKKYSNHWSNVILTLKLLDEGKRIGGQRVLEIRAAILKVNPKCYARIILSERNSSKQTKAQKFATN